MESTIFRRIIIKELTFKEEGTFKSLYAAQGWLHENGYQYGSLCGDMPVGFTVENYDLPQKWKNFDVADKLSVDGVMVSSDFREGEVRILLYK